LHRIGIVSPTALDAGCTVWVCTTEPVVVRIAGEGIQCYGSTCYCKPDESGGYLVGIHFVR